MKIRISVSEEKRDLVARYLTEHGIELGEEAEYMITESSRYPIEAFGKDIEVHTMQGTFFAQDRMYQMESLLDPQEFLRISKSVIISRKHVKKIRPSLSMKYILTMSDGTLADVTRSYYSDFRRFFNI